MNRPYKIVHPKGSLPDEICWNDFEKDYYHRFEPYYDHTKNIAIIKEICINCNTEKIYLDV